MWTLLLASALAVEVDLGVGAELLANEPFLNPVGARGAVTLRPLPWLGAGLSLAGYPVRIPTAQLDRLATLGLVPDVAPVRATGSVTAQARFARLDGERLHGSLDLVVGVAGVWSVDDCEAILAADDPVCLATQSQVHPAGVVGLAAGAGRGRWGARLRVEAWRYTEVVNGVVDESKRPVWAGVDLVWRTGGGDG